MTFENFKDRVKEIVPSNRWYHILPAISPICRERFLSLLQTGIPIPKAYKIIEEMKSLNDDEFVKHLEIISKTM